MARIAGLVAGCLACILCPALQAQRLVRDIADRQVDPPPPDLQGSFPGAFQAAHALVWFTATGHGWARNPWISDGTEAGTRVVAALPDALSFTPLGSPWAIGVSGNGTLLWRSDGTAAGTTVLRRLAVAGSPFARFGNRLLFYADDGLTGMEPWVTDGTVQGTQLLADVRLGLAGSQPSDTYRPELFGLGALALFVADDGVYGMEPWITDGTPAGTHVVDIRPGAEGSLERGVPRPFVTAVDRVCFAANDGTHGLEPWVSDGTVTGTQLLADLMPGSASGAYFSLLTVRLIAFGNGFLFAGIDPAAGSEPWISDGTPAGTRRLADLMPGTASSGPTEFFLAGSRVAFGADHPTLGRELWITDGTAAGTVLLKDIHPGSGSSAPRVVSMEGAWRSGKALFQADDGKNGQELWMTDGTGAGTQLLADLQPGNGSSEVRQAWALESYALFAFGVGPAGLEPWVTDGTTAGTHLLRDIRPGTRSSLPNDSFLPARAGSKLVFAADDGEHGLEPWVTDGTPAGTIMLRDIGRSGTPGSRPRLMGALLEQLVFEADDARSGNEPWISDGTEAGTRLLADLAPGPGSSGRPNTSRYGVEMADRLVFQMHDPAVGMEPWVTDGTTGGTHLLADIHPGKVDSAASWPTKVGRSVFFEANDGKHGRELWVSDGTRAGTRLVKDINPGAADSQIGGQRSFPPVAIGDRLLFFSADDGVHGQEPWISDGSDDGTVMLRDLRAGSEHGVLGTRYYGSAALGEHALFFGYDANAGYDPFVTDGTPGGTRLLGDLEPGPYAYLFLFPERLPRFPDGRVLLSTQAEIWITDLTPAETKPLAPGRCWDWAALGEVILFANNDLAHGAELWISDGTPAGTHMLLDLRAGMLSSLPGSFERSGDLVFFRANDGLHGRELWVTDGTADGTRLVADFHEGPGDGLAWDDLFASAENQRILLSALSIEHGQELWSSDGTTAGTRLVRDLEPGPDGSFPQLLARVGDMVLLRANTKRAGEELFAVDLRDFGAGISVSLGTGCTGSGARIPTLATTGAPVLGTSAFRAELTRARPLAPASLIAGRGPGPLPLAGGCSWYLGPYAAHLHTTITDPNGRSAVNLAIPRDPNLLGAKFHAQALVLDPVGAWLGLAALSNALTIVVGR